MKRLSCFYRQLVEAARSCNGLGSLLLGLLDLLLLLPFLNQLNPLKIYACATSLNHLPLWRRMRVPNFLETRRVGLPW